MFTQCKHNRYKFYEKIYIMFDNYFNLLYKIKSANVSMKISLCALHE